MKTLSLYTQIFRTGRGNQSQLWKLEELFEGQTILTATTSNATLSSNRRRLHQCRVGEALQRLGGFSID